MTKEKRTKPMMGPGGGHPGRRNRGPVEKAKDARGSLRRLLNYIGEYRLAIIFVIFLTIVSTVFTVVSPRVMAQATNTIVEGLGLGAIDFEKIARILLNLLGLYLLSAVFAYFQRYIMVGISQKVVYRLREDVDKKLSRLPLKYFDQHQLGDTLSRITNDVDNISTTLQQTLTQLITSVISVIGIFIMMLRISPLMTLITVLVLPLGVLATKNIAKKSQEFFKGQSDNLGSLNGHIEEMYSGHSIVKAYNMEGESIKEFERINDNLYEASYKAQFISGIIRPLMGLINNIGYVLVSVVGGFLVLDARISIGDIQAFIQYSRQFNQPIIQAADVLNTIQSTIASAERVFEILDEEEEEDLVEEWIARQDRRGQVSIEGLDFSYEEEEDLIRDMNIEVDSGDTVAIVGPTGAGKTTLVNLLMRFYEIDRGRILIDGLDIVDMPRSQLRNIFGMVLQDTWLFNGSIGDNIRYGRLDASEEEVREAARIAQADFFIRTLPQGYDTILDEEASNISQGQKQLLTIARAVLANPEIMILDEATSSVDTRTEVLIQRAMDQVMEGRTSFVIAHRLSTIRNADVILVMNEGRIIEQGNHKELMEKGGFYYDLYNSQFAA